MVLHYVMKYEILSSLLKDVFEEYKILLHYIAMIMALGIRVRFRTTFAISLQNASVLWYYRLEWGENGKIVQ